MQQLASEGAVEHGFQAHGMLAGETALWIISGQVHHHVVVLALPVSRLARQFGTLRMQLQTRRPRLIGAGFGRQAQGLSLTRLVVGRLQVFEQ